MAEYFLRDNPGFGNLSWLLMAGWLIGLGAGAYLYSVWQERNPVRARFFRQLGLGLSIVSALGILLLALKAIGVPYLEWRLWSYLAALATLAFGGWAFWFYRTRYPRLMAATRAAPGTVRRAGARSGHGAKTYAANGSVAAQSTPTPRPVATTGRREARREKKRRSR